MMTTRYEERACDCSLGGTHCHLERPELRSVAPESNVVVPELGPFGHLVFPRMYREYNDEDRAALRAVTAEGKLTRRREALEGLHRWLTMAIWGAMTGCWLELPWHIPLGHPFEHHSFWTQTVVINKAKAEERRRKRLAERRFE